MSDSELLKRLITIFRRYLNDQASDSPHHKIKNIPDEIHGELADLLFQDKVKNQLAVTILLKLVVDRSRDRTDAEIMQLLRDIYDSLTPIVL